MSKTNLDKAIRINCGGEVFEQLKQLHHFQGKLKEITPDDFYKLKQSLIKHGLPLAFHIWIDSKKKKWILDGHHRRLALLELEQEGYFVPPIPCNIVHAKTKKEAAQVIMISNAKYAKMTDDSFSAFMVDNDLSIPDMEFLSIPDIDPFLESSNDLESSDINNSSKELDLNKFDNFQNQCPKCGFEWNKNE